MPALRLTVRPEHLSSLVPTLTTARCAPHGNQDRFDCPDSPGNPTRHRITPPSASPSSCRADGSHANLPSFFTRPTRQPVVPSSSCPSTASPRAEPDFVSLVTSASYPLLPRHRGHRYATFPSDLPSSFFPPTTTRLTPARSRLGNSVRRRALGCSFHRGILLALFPLPLLSSPLLTFPQMNPLSHRRSFLPFSRSPLFALSFPSALWHNPPLILLAPRAGPVSDRACKRLLL